MTMHVQSTQLPGTHAQSVTLSPVLLIFVDAHIKRCLWHWRIGVKIRARIGMSTRELCKHEYDNALGFCDWSTQRRGMKRVLGVHAHLIVQPRLICGPRVQSVQHVHLGAEDELNGIIGVYQSRQWSEKQGAYRRQW